MRLVGRRDILRLAGAGALAAGITRVFALPGASGSVRDAVDGKGSGKGSGSVATIGRRYIELTPAESTAESLGAQLPAGAVDGVGAIVWPVVAATAKDDFARGDVVSIDGWRLARSEARAAAFVVVAR